MSVLIMCSSCWSGQTSRGESHRESTITCTSHQERATPKAGSSDQQLGGWPVSPAVSASVSQVSFPCQCCQVFNWSTEWCL